MMSDSGPVKRPPISIGGRLKADSSQVLNASSCMRSANSAVATTLYRPQSIDTTVESDKLFFHLLRQQTVSQRLERAARHTQSINSLCLSGIKRRNPDAPVSAIREKFAIAKLRSVPQGIAFTGEDESMWVQDSITLARDLGRLFEAHGILYYVTGGVAASTHGEPRSTIDLDLVVQIGSSDAEALAAILTANGFYCPEGAVEEVKRGIKRSFQATHQETIATVDIFLADGSEFSEMEMARRLWIEEGFYVSSAEDTVLQKLKWGKASQSEKQFRDVLGILKLQQGELDYDYLRQWADRLGLTQALTLALQASTDEGPEP